MHIASIIFAVVFGCVSLWAYVGLIRATMTLVEEARLLYPARRFNQLWWPAAWRPHRAAVPESRLRRTIVLGYLKCWLFMVLALGCAVFSKSRRFGIP